MGIFWVGLALGGVLAVWLGGALASAIGWRLTLVAVGLPGLLFALLLTRLRDPVARTAPIRHPTRRRYINWRAVLRTSMPLLGSLALASLVTGGLMLIEPLPPNVDVAVFGVIAGAGALWSVLLWVRAVLRAPHLFAVGVPADFLDEMTEAVGLVLRTPTLIWLFIGGALTSAAMNALVAWSPSFLQRELGMTLLAAGQVIGPVGLIGAVLGSWSGGRLGDRLLERFAGGRVLASSLGFLIGAPICMWMLLVNDRAVFAALFLFVAFFYTWYNGPVAAALFDVVPRGIGGTVMGAYIFFIHIAGDAIALPVVGALSDRLGLRAALLSLPMVGLLGGVILLFALFTVRSDMARITPPTGA
jgi:MFS family permease